jgi:hypothetical protein
MKILHIEKKGPMPDTYERFHIHEIGKQKIQLNNFTQTYNPIYCDVFTVLETPFGLLLRFIYDFTSRHYNYFYNVTRTRLTASSLPCSFFILVGPLIAGFLVAALILGLSDLTFRL